MAKILYAAGTYNHIRCFHTDYIEALRKEGHEVLTMASGEGADFEVSFEKKMLSPKNFASWRRISKIVKEEKFDAILLNTTLAAFNVRMALSRKRPRVVNLVHGYMFEKKPKGLKEKIFLLAEKHLRKKTDGIMVMNEDDLVSAKKYRLTGGETVLIRGMGAELKPPRMTESQIRDSLDSEDKYAICFVGELCSAKNQEMLIRLLPRIKESIPNAVLWLLGRGGGEADLRKLAQDLSVADLVRFTGYVDNPTDYVRAADLYVSPSKKEGLPFNVIEALGAAKPIIVTNIRGHRDLITDTETGFLFDKDSPEELLVKINAIHSSEALCNEEKQREFYDKYSKAEVFDNTLGVMKSLLKI